MCVPGSQLLSDVQTFCCKFWEIECRLGALAVGFKSTNSYLLSHMHDGCLKQLAVLQQDNH